MGYILSISQFSVNENLVNRISINMYAPMQPGEEFEDRDHIEYNWDNSIYNEQEYIILNRTKDINRAAENY